MATTRICTVGSCDRMHQAHGLCVAHLHRLRRTGSTHASTPVRPYGQPKTPTEPEGRLVPDLPQTDLEARQRALIRAMVKSASETTAWDPLQYLAELLSDAEDVRDVRSSWTPTAWSRSEQ